MLTHLLQIASFKSKPQNMVAPLWSILVASLFLVVIQAYALSFTPGNELLRMAFASAIKLVVIAGLMYGWMRSVNCNTHFAASLLVIVVISVLSEVVKLPLGMMIKDTRQTAEVIKAIALSLPYWAVIAWQYSVWYYVFKEVSQRSKAEVVTVMVSLVLISEVAGSVLSKVGLPVEGFS